MTLNERDVINHFLVKVFNDILKTEELSISDKTFPNLSLREIHVLEAICEAEEQGNNNSTSIADALYVTPGTLTTSVTLLEKKGFIKRKKDEKDKRIVRIYTTDIGKEAQAKHVTFHDEMVDAILTELDDDEANVFCRALDKLDHFFYRKYFDRKKRGGNK